MTFLLEDADGPDPPGPCALQQHPRYAAALRRIGAETACLTAREAGRVIATARVVRRRFGPLPVAWLARGPVWAPDAPHNLRRHALKDLPLGGVPLAQPESAEDTAAFQAAGYRALLTPPHVAELDLTRSAGDRLRTCHGKWRNRLRQAGASGLSTDTRPFRPDRDDRLLALETRQRRDRRYTALPPSFTLAWAALGPAATRLFIARQGGDLAAFLLLLLHPPVATYHIGWTGSAGRRLSAHNLLLWQASDWLASQGFTRLDLGIVDTDNTPGLARFKIGSGADIRPLGPTLLRLPGLARLSRTA